MIVDNFVDQKVLTLLAEKAPGVTIEILTRSASSMLKVVGDAFSKEHGGLSIRTSEAFHDRFVIIDKAEFYHLGASIKDLGLRGFMYSRIEEPEIIASLRTKLRAEWEQAEKVI